MKKRKILALTVITSSLLLLAGGVGLVWAQGVHLGSAVGTAFTYQGQLMDNESPAEGTYDFEFKLHDDPTLDSQVGSTVYVENKEVRDGLFTVQLDFGSGIFNGEARYLEIGVRPGDSSGDYTTLTPRQELTAAPYAHYALDSLSTESLQGHPVSDTVPTTGQLLQWNGSAWIPTTMASTNQPPVAVLQADRKVLMPGETTTLSLTLSYDPEGGALTYAFDPTGETLGAPSSYGGTGTTTVTSADYEAGGDYLAAGWVKDASGAFDVAQALISVWQFWTTTVDSAGDVGEFASLAVVDGRPAIAYFDDTNDDLKYVLASDATGSSWGLPVTVDSAGTVGWYTSLAVVDGRPAIAYYDGNPNYNLKYVRASDAAGSSWGTPVTVDSAGDVGEFASLAVVDGRPAIAYYDASPNYDLKYVRADDATGYSWGTPATVTSSGSVGQYSSLAVVDGNPAIAYYDQSTYSVKYVRASDVDGSSWGTPVTVDTAYHVGWYASLAVVDGRPAVAYHEFTNHYLKYAWASDATGSSWDTSVTLDSSGHEGWYASLAVVGGRPAVAYLDHTNEDLKYVRASDVAGSSWGTPVTVDSTGDVGTGASLAVVDGRPAIAYYDDTNGDLRFAILRHE